MKRKFFVLTVIAALTALTVVSAAPAAAAGWESGVASPAASDAAPAGFSAQAYRNETLRLVNQQRAARSLRPLTAAARLNSMAAVRAQEASSRFSHIRPNGSTPASLFAQYGVSYSRAGENLARGYESPAALVSAWMLSPEHRSNILNAGFTCTGIGVYQTSGGKVYCAQLFSRP